MGPGFSVTSHHGPELHGGTEASNDDDSAAADTDTETTAGTTSATSEQHNGTTNELECLETHVKPSNSIVKTWIPHNQYKRQKNRLKKQPITVVFNESKLILTQDMEKVLNRGLKFAITPLKLDITQVLTEFRRFERTMVWYEFWFGRKTEEAYKPPMFKAKKSNFPRNHRAPKGLNDFLAAVKSDIMDPKNRNVVRSNISEGEKEALKELVKLQKERQIVIKPCDKGAGIIILDFQEYLRACLKHLESKTKTGEKYYEKVDQTVLLKAKEKIAKIVQEGYDNNILNKEEFTAMTPAEDVKPGRFYATFKVHKQYEHGTAPPERAIVSCSGTFSENIAIFVEHHLQEAGSSHSSYIKDTPDFLRQLQDLNLAGELPLHALLVVIDAIGLYTNIPQEEGVQCVEEALEEQSNSTVPGKYIARLLEIILQHSVFAFDKELYQQKVGTSMGTKPAPSYADIFIARKVDRRFFEIAE